MTTTTDRYIFDRAVEVEMDRMREWDAVADEDRDARGRGW